MKFVYITVGICLALDLWMFIQTYYWDRNEENIEKNYLTKEREKKKCIQSS